MSLFIALVLFVASVGCDTIDDKFYSEHCVKTVVYSYFSCPNYKYPDCTPWRCDKGKKSAKLRTCVVYDCEVSLATELGQKFVTKPITSSRSNASSILSAPVNSTSLAVVPFSKNRNSSDVETSLSMKRNSTKASLLPSIANISTALESIPTGAPTNFTSTPTPSFTPSSTRFSTSTSRTTPTILKALSKSTSTSTSKHISTSTSRSTPTILKALSKSTSTSTSTSSSTYTSTSTTSKAFEGFKMSNNSLFKDEGYCKEHYDCTEEKKFSFTGCVTYYDNGNPACHLYCQLENCGAHYSPRSQECTFYHCASKTTSTSTTTPTTTSTTTVSDSTMSPLTPIHVHNPFLWSTVVLGLLLFSFVIFWAGKRFGGRRMRRHLAKLYAPVQPGQVSNSSPNEETPLTNLPLTTLTNDAWQTQNLFSAEGSSCGDDELAYFEAKLVRPRPFSFPKIDSVCEKFSVIDHRIELDKAYFPHKEALICESPDEYKAILDIKTLQKDLDTTVLYLDELHRSLVFLKSEQRASRSSSIRAERIATVRAKFESRIKLTTCEVTDLKQKLQVAYECFEQVKTGHSYFSVTGRVTAAGERLMPTLSEIERSDRARAAERLLTASADIERSDLLDSISIVTDFTSV